MPKGPDIFNLDGKANDNWTDKVTVPTANWHLTKKHRGPSSTIPHLPDYLSKALSKNSVTLLSLKVPFRSRRQPAEIPSAEKLIEEVYTPALKGGHRKRVTPCSQAYLSFHPDGAQYLYAFPRTAR